MIHTYTYTVIIKLCALLKDTQIKNEIDYTESNKLGIKPTIGRCSLRVTTIDYFYFFPPKMCTKYFVKTS